MGTYSDQDHWQEMLYGAAPLHQAELSNDHIAAPAGSQHGRCRRDAPHGHASSASPRHDGPFWGASSLPSELSIRNSIYPHHDSRQSAHPSSSSVDNPFSFPQNIHQKANLGTALNRHSAPGMTHLDQGGTLPGSPMQSKSSPFWCNAPIHALESIFDTVDDPLMVQLMTSPREGCYEHAPAMVCHSLQQVQLQSAPMLDEDKTRPATPQVPQHELSPQPCEEAMPQLHDCIAQDCADDRAGRHGPLSMDGALGMDGNLSHALRQNLSGSFSGRQDRFVVLDALSAHGSANPEPLGSTASLSAHHRQVESPASQLLQSSMPLMCSGQQLPRREQCLSGEDAAYEASTVCYTPHGNGLASQARQPGDRHSTLQQLLAQINSSGPSPKVDQSHGAAGTIIGALAHSNDCPSSMVQAPHIHVVLRCTT
jgi:hypothetical protein